MREGGERRERERENNSKTALKAVATQLLHHDDSMEHCIS